MMVTSGGEKPSVGEWEHKCSGKHRSHPESSLTTSLSVGLES